MRIFLFFSHAEYKQLSRSFKSQKIKIKSVRQVNVLQKLQNFFQR